MGTESDKTSKQIKSMIGISMPQPMNQPTALAHLEMPTSIIRTATPAISLLQSNTYNQLNQTIMQISSAFSNIAANNIQLYCTTAIDQIAKVLQCYNFSAIANSMNRVATNYTSILGGQFASIFKTFDFVPLRAIAEGFARFGYNIKYTQYKTVYCNVMYQAEWLPYLNFEVETDLFVQLNNIIDTSRPGSKRQVSRINKTMIDYYTDTKIKKISKSWRELNIEKHYAKMLSHTVNAYFRKEYILTICCLATLWETFLFKYESKERHNGKVVINKFKDLSEESNDNKLTEALCDFFEKLIMGQCNNPDEVKDDLPNRNGVAHGWWNRYPTKKSALNSILLTDLILKL